MNCPHCSQPLKSGARFCAACGATITPPATDQTMIASAMPAYPPPAEAGKTDMDPPVRSNVGAALPPQLYGQPQAGNLYQAPQQPYPGQYAQPYAGMQTPAYVPAGYGPQGYGVPQGGGIPLTNGRTAAILMLVGALTFVVSMFLPFLQNRSQTISIVDMLSEIIGFGVADVPGAAWLFVALPVVALLSFLFSALALWKRRQVWGVLDLIAGLLVFGFAGLLLIGARDSSAGYEAGVAIWLMFMAGLVLFVSSIGYLARKKAPR